MKTRYKLHWASGRGPSPELKWQIWDWAIYAPVAHLENRALARKVCALLNQSLVVTSVKRAVASAKHDGL